MATKQQIKRLWASAKARGLENETIRELIYDATGGRTQHSSEMSFDEINNLIGELNKMGDTKANKIRKKMLAMAHKLGWLQIWGNGAKVDMERVNNWCVHYGKFGKKLNEHSYKELCQLVTQFEKVYASYL